MLCFSGNGAQNYFLLIITDGILFHDISTIAILFRGISLLINKSMRLLAVLLHVKVEPNILLHEWECDYQNFFEY